MAVGTLLVTDARVWPSPDERVGDPVSILIEDGCITDVGARVSAPAEVPRFTAAGRVVTAGFCNCHIHLTGEAWGASDTAVAADLQRSLDVLFLSHGFTTVWDLSSNPCTTFALIRRVGSGELRGPEILTAASGLTPWWGMPYYVREHVPWYLRWVMPAPATELGARLTVAAQIRRGARLTKLFTGSYVRRDRVKPMRMSIARGAVTAAHRRGVRVLAHPSNRAGTEIAVGAGVDGLAHLPDDTDGTHELLREAARKGIRVIPTLHMFASTVTTDEGYLAPIRAALRGFVESGGRVLFGTDAGYLADFDPRGEFTAMRAAGMTSREILRSLTTEPAAFLDRDDLGEVKVGHRGDLVVLKTVSETDPVDFAAVHATIREGNVVFPGPSALGVTSADVRSPSRER